MKKSDVVLAILSFENAFKRLKEAVEIAKDELDKDGTIQRFEFCFELFWKMLKIVLQFSGFECATPRACIKEAFKIGLIGDDELFIDMLEDRNLSSHIYNSETSLQIFERIKNVYIKAFENALKNLKEKIQI
ncbi:MAG: nucleotidyltransferase substrate binding protein [Thermoanaerobaculia bacterium]